MLNSKLKSQKSKLQLKSQNSAKLSFKFLATVLRFKFCALSLRQRRGFTLIELLVVITIIGILITLVTVAVVPVQRRSRDAKRKAEVNSFLSGINLFKADFKIYPNPTFNLGDQANATDGNLNSNYAISSDVVSCNNAPIGATSTFSTNANPTVPLLDDKTPGATKITLKPGFVSVNNFLICLRYMDRVLVDPKPVSASLWDKYQYRVSYDYGDVVVTSKLENEATDSDASKLFNQATALKRYYRGSGSVVRHLDDDSDSDSTVLTDVNYNFFSSLFVLGGANVTDGKYLYQCKKTSATGVPSSTAISPDSRVTYEPIVSGTTSYGANSTCNNAAGDLDVIVAY